MFFLTGDEIMPADINDKYSIIYNLNGVKIPFYFVENSAECIDGEEKSIPKSRQTVVNDITIENNVTNNFDNQQNQNNTIKDRSSTPTAMPISQSDKHNKKRNDKTSSKRNYFNIPYAVILIIVVGVAAVGIRIYINNGKEIAEETDPTETKIIDVFEKIADLERTYSKQRKGLWATLRLGMRKLLKQNNSPTTILLLHSENSTVDTCFLRDIKNIITNDIALFQHTQRVLNEVDEQTGHLNQVAFKPKGVVINMETSNDIYDNPGMFMTRYKTQLEQDKILIVINFHKSPLRVMEAFHFLSDTLDPWVKNLLIILTLPIKNPKITNKSSEYIAESELRELLKSLPDNIGDPLITRLTENVYIVPDEDSSVSRTSCSL